MGMITSTVRKVAVLIGGGLLTLVGIILLFIPGPGLVLIFAGLALLATEYPWARRRLDDMKARTRRLMHRQ
ncbi:MAG: hypothetical protein HKN07_16210 [Acidimicrobiia bacterium]|nr:hypothetical protein [Acidimicrobiia bacterium]